MNQESRKTGNDRLRSNPSLCAPLLRSCFPAFLIIIAFPAFAQPLPQPERTPTRDELRHLNLQIVELSRGLQADLDATNANAARIASSLANAVDSLAAATAANLKLQPQIDTLANEKGALELKVAGQNAKIRVLYTIIALMGGTMATYAFLKFYLRVPFL